MTKKSGYDYYDALLRMAEYAATAAGLLQEILADYKRADLVEMMEKMHEIEHAADMEKHDMHAHLAKEFIPPIEREDIISLASMIDDVVDDIEDMLLRLYMFRIVELREEVPAFTDIIVCCCGALKETLQEFRHFRKSTTILKNIVEVNRLEGEGDKLYTEAVHRLYHSGNDARELMVWTEMFDRFERCCDECEHVANMVESVMMKNA